MSKRRKLKQVLLRSPTQGHMGGNSKVLVLMRVGEVRELSPESILIPCDHCGDEVWLRPHMVNYDEIRRAGARPWALCRSCAATFHPEVGRVLSDYA
jgi:hypothetical protein